MANHIATEEFTDLQIRIFPRQADAYPVEITLGGQIPYPQGHLPASILPWTSSGVPAQDGQRLFEALFASRALYGSWGEARGRAQRRRIRLQIDTDAAELHALPWELLQAGPNTLAAHIDTPFSRYLPIAAPWGEPVQDFPIRVLVVISNPSDLKERFNLDPVDVALERKILEHAFDTVGANKLQADFLDASVTPKRLEETLRQGYHMLHLVGHGAFNVKRAQAALYLQDEAGQARRLLDHQLANMLTRQTVRPQLVFLVACQSGRRSTSDALIGLAPKLVTTGVPAVVAMQDIITIETAREFSSSFYQRLLERGIVDLAMNQARSQILDTNPEEVGIPALFMRLRDGLLFQPIRGQKMTPTSDIDLSAVDPIQLREAMIQVYDKPGLEMLCSTLFNLYKAEGVPDSYGVQYDSLRGEAWTLKVMYLIDWHQRHGRLEDLVSQVLKERPNIVEHLP